MFEMTYLTQLYDTEYVPVYQLRMNFNVDMLIPEDDKVRLVCEIVDRMDLGPVLRTYSRLGRKPALDPITYFKILLFCYSEGIYSTRKIEKFSKYDLRAHYLLNGQAAPHFTSISRFRNNLETHVEGLLQQFVEVLIQDGHVDLENVFIDGTKIEAVANRYSFVWRKSVEKYLEKLRQRMVVELLMPEQSPLEKVIERVRHMFQQAVALCEYHQVQFVHGTGKRKTQFQRDYEHYHEVLERFEQYAQHLEIMGDRNSYSKTDHDATFMRMKDDHMLNGQLKPAYNIQLASSGGFVVGAMATQRANDFHAMRPFVGQLRGTYGERLKNVVLDAGYESIENYVYLKEHSLVSYIKPANYEIKKTRKFRKDIGRRENMPYDEAQDAYVCKNGKLLKRQKDSVKKYPSGYVDTLWNYACFECGDCPYNSQCIKSKAKTLPTKKTLKYSPAFTEYRAESQANITSSLGIDLRLNRSIQAEGMFSKLKDGLGYDRFRHKGLPNVLSEMNLMGMAININKLHAKIQRKQTGIIVYKKAV